MLSGEVVTCIKMCKYADVQMLNYKNPKNFSKKYLNDHKVTKRTFACTGLVSTTTLTLFRSEGTFPD